MQRVAKRVQYTRCSAIRSREKERDPGEVKTNERKEKRGRAYLQWSNGHDDPVRATLDPVDRCWMFLWHGSVHGPPTCSWRAFFKMAEVANVQGQRFPPRRCLISFRDERKHTLLSLENGSPARLSHPRLCTRDNEWGGSMEDWAESGISYCERCLINLLRTKLWDDSRIILSRYENVTRR